jgi:hypothetical protein
MLFWQLMGSSLERARPRGEENGQLGVGYMVLIFFYRCFKYSDLLILRSSGCQLILVPVYQISVYYDKIMVFWINFDFQRNI